MLDDNLIKDQIISIKPLIGKINPQETDEYAQARVYAISKNSFTIEIPSSEFPYMTKGTKISLLFNRNGRLLAGQSKILEVDKDYLWLRLSNPDKLQRVEMRKWFRVPVTLNMRYRMAGYKFDYFTTNTLNISGGGLMFLASHIVDRDLDLEIEIGLPDQNMVRGIVKVRRCEELEAPKGVYFGIGCSLEQIDENEREKLIKFLFDQQRALIQKRSLYHK
ncbi:MAG: PilZ domain-containing protein [Syntrophomonas sp.]